MTRVVDIGGHQEVHVVADRRTGLRAIVAVHSTARGPAAGGLRMRPYRSMDDGLRDVLDLSRAMSLKNAAANLPLGGGKSIIIGDPSKDKTVALLEAFGRLVERFGGDYWVAEDMGVGPNDMAVIAHTTRYVAGLAHGPHAGGDPSPVTAEGVLQGLKIALKHRTGSDSLSGRTVAVQGLGHVGLSLCAKLRSGGAKIVFTDIDREAVAKAEQSFGAHGVEPEAIYAVDADVFAPCAVGGTLNERTIPQLKVHVVAGAANNQLVTPEDADRLHNRGILYAPDFVINGGGIINVAAEILKMDEPRAWVNRKLAELTETLDNIISKAMNENVSPLLVAQELAEKRLLS